MKKSIATIAVFFMGCAGTKTVTTETVEPPCSRYKDYECYLAQKETGPTEAPATKAGKRVLPLLEVETKDDVSRPPADPAIARLFHEQQSHGKRLTMERRYGGGHEVRSYLDSDGNLLRTEHYFNERLTDDGNIAAIINFKDGNPATWENWENGRKKVAPAATAGITP